MNKSWFYLGVVGSLAVLTTSCGGDAKPPTPAPTPAVTASPAAAVPPTTPAPVAATPGTPAAPGTTADTAATSGKSVAAKPVSVDVAAGLIPPTDGESWAKTVSKGRSDPFGMLALQPLEIIEPIDPLTQAVTPKQSSAKIVNNNSTSAVTKASSLPTANVAVSSTKTTKVSSNERTASPTANVGESSTRATKVSSNERIASPTANVAESSTRATKVSSNERTASNSNTVNSGGNSQLNTVSISAIPRTGINRSLPKIVVALREPTPTTVKEPKPVSVVKSPPAQPKIIAKVVPAPAIAKTTVAKVAPAPAIAKTTVAKVVPAPAPAKTTVAQLAPAKTTIAKASNNNPVLRPVPTVQPQAPKVAPVNRAPVNTQIAATAKPEKIAEKPLQAMAIEISGIIEVNGETQVIIKLPTESFSRYIAVGERIGNGKVLVKRVEGQNGITPTVVLEEVGVEVLRRIGEKPESINPTP